jgi:ribosome-interacting GTPase 1
MLAWLGENTAISVAILVLLSILFTFVIANVIKENKKESSHQQDLAKIADYQEVFKVTDEEQISLAELKKKSFRQLNLALNHLHPNITFEEKGDEEDCYLLINLEVNNVIVKINARLNHSFNFAGNQKSTASTDLSPKTLNRVFQELEMGIDLQVAA